MPEIDGIVGLEMSLSDPFWDEKLKYGMKLWRFSFRPTLECVESHSFEWVEYQVALPLKSLPAVGRGYPDGEHSGCHSGFQSVESIFEDDAWPIKNICRRLQSFIEKVPTDIKFLILGWNSSEHIPDSYYCGKY